MCIDRFRTFIIHIFPTKNDLNIEDLVKDTSLRFFTWQPFPKESTAEAVDGDGDEKKDTMPLLWRWEALA